MAAVERNQAHRDAETIVANGICSAVANVQRSAITHADRDGRVRTSVYVSSIRFAQAEAVEKAIQGALSMIVVDGVAWHTEGRLLCDWHITATRDGGSVSDESHQQMKQGPPEEQQPQQQPCQEQDAVPEAAPLPPPSQLPQPTSPLPQQQQQQQPPQHAPSLPLPAVPDGATRSSRKRRAHEDEQDAPTVSLFGRLGSIAKNVGRALWRGSATPDKRKRTGAVVREVTHETKSAAHQANHPAVAVTRSDKTWPPTDGLFVELKARMDECNVLPRDRAAMARTVDVFSVMIKDAVAADGAMNCGLFMRPAHKDQVNCTCVALVSVGRCLVDLKLARAVLAASHDAWGACGAGELLFGTNQVTFIVCPSICPVHRNAA